MLTMWCVFMRTIPSSIVGLIEAVVFTRWIHSIFVWVWKCLIGDWAEVDVSGALRLKLVKTPVYTRFIELQLSADHGKIIHEVDGSKPL